MDYYKKIKKVSDKKRFFSGFFADKKRPGLFASFGGTGIFFLPSRPGQVILYVLYLPEDCRMCNKASGFLRIIREEQFRSQLSLLYGGYKQNLIGLQRQ